MTLIDEMTSLLNRHSVGNQSNTPDYLLAGYLMQCLATWNSITRQRDMWHGVIGSQAPDMTRPGDTIHET